jgi:hypothetical protein
MAQKKRGSATPRFKVRDKVRVKRGIPDPNFEDIPLGGWTGTITKVEPSEDDVLYEIKWDRRTLDGIHPVYRKRCERDGLELEVMWLGEDDLEPEEGPPVPIEQPTEIRTPPLSDHDEDDRVRMALGLTHDDPLPDVTDETLFAYHRYLAAHLKFPLQVTAWAKASPFSSKKVTVALTSLADPREGGIDEEYGLIALGRDAQGEELEVPIDELELGKKDPNRRLLSDYSYWFHNYG